MVFQNSFTSQSNLAITDGRLLKSQNQFLLRLWCLESYEVDFLWPKLLNYQLMLCKSNFILWMSENFDWTKIFSLLNITFWTISKTFWYSQNWNWISKTLIGTSEVLNIGLYCLNGLKSLRKSHLHNHRPTFSQKFNEAYLSSSISIYSNLHEIKMTPH